MNEEPKIWASLGMKVNIQNYENQDISFGFSGIPVNCSQEYLDQTVAQGVQRIQFIIEAMATELSRVLKESYGR